MAYPCQKGVYKLDTDARGKSIGAALGRDRVIADSSKTIRKAERKYCITDKQLLGRKFLIRNDHQALKWICMQPKGT
jgi:hypothetical protein